MADSSPLAGYSGQVWARVFACLEFLFAELSLVPSVAAATLDAVADATLQTCINGLAAVNAYQILNAWQQEHIDLQQIQALPITVSPTEAAFVNNRVAAYNAAQAALSPLVPNVQLLPSITTTLPLGEPAIPDPGLLTFYQNFGYETPPGGLTIAGMLSSAQAFVAAFQDVASKIFVFQGPQYLTEAYDSAVRQATTGSVAVNILSSFTSGPLASTMSASGVWNQMVTLPSMLTDAAMQDNAPYLVSGQQSALVRYLILQNIRQIGIFLLSLRSPQFDNVQLTTLRNNETLMDVAARTLGNFERWTEIATVNGLQPPYVGFDPAPGVATFGSRIIIPTPGAHPSNTGQAPSYINNFLGIDLFLGPINGGMPPWTGDFQIISGLTNLTISLGRRLQTTLGTLLYHSDFGSRIPPEVGQVQTSATAGQITAFGKAAILSDPRVAAVLAASSRLLPNNQIDFSANVQPAGFGSEPVTLNQVLAPLP